MEVAALIVSLIAVAISAVAAGWTMYAWKASGAVLRLSVKPSVVGGLNGAVQCVGISVANAGRLETEIGSIQFPMTNGRVLVVWPDIFIGDKLPTSIGPGASRTFLLPIHELVNILVQENVSAAGLKVLVRTGHGDFEAYIGKKFLESIEGKRLAAL